MPEVVWLEGENGAVLSMTAPLPLAMQRRVDAGRMRLTGPPGAGPAQQSPGPEPERGEVPVPSNGASRADWERYALSQGMPAVKAEGLTRNQLAQAMRLRSAS